MSLVHDWKDWLGGYPYEVASRERMATYMENLGFELVKTLEPYIVDDETVAKTDGTATRSAAGKVVGLDSDGVWVE